MKFKRIVFVLGVIVLFFWTVLFSYQLVMHYWHWNEQQQQAVSFVQGNNEQLIGNYTALEQSHMNDVRQVMSVADVTFVALTLLLGTLLYEIYTQKNVGLFFLWGGITTVGIVLILLLGVFFFFDALFVGFHTIFFPKGNWQFSSEGLLIQIFPLELFISLGKTIFLMVLGEGSFFILLGIFLCYGCRKCA